MTLSVSSFTTIPAESLMADAAINSPTLRAMAENTHIVHRLLTDENLPGGASALAGHDHASNGGAPIPFFQVQALGQPSTSRLTGTDTSIPFCRMPSSLSLYYDLQRSQTPDAQISGTVASTRSTIWLSGDATSRLSGSDYLTIADGVNTGRYVIKAMRYEATVNASAVTLWDRLATAPATGSAVIGWSQCGDRDLYLAVPTFASKITLVMPLAATLSVSLEDGEQLLSIEAGESDAWTQRARLVCGTHTGPWLPFYPDGRRSLNWQALSMDCSALADGERHTFWVEVEANADALKNVPFSVSLSDCALWTRLPTGGPRPDALAIFSRI